MIKVIITIFRMSWINYQLYCCVCLNLHFNRIIIYILLILGCIETNPGPSFIKSSLLVNLDIITLSETHLDNSISNENISIEGFHPPIRKDRNRHGGGVAMYISDQLAYHSRMDLSIDVLEILWSEIHNGNKKNVISCTF